MLSSLPERPLTLHELHALHRKDAFVAATPVNAVTDSNKARQRSLVVGAILVNDDVIAGVNYDIESRSWEILCKKANEPESEKTEEGFVLGVHQDVEAALEEKAQEMQESGFISEVVDRNEDEEGQTELRDAEKYGRVLQDQYEEAT